MAQALRAVFRLVATSPAQPLVASGVQNSVRGFGTTSLLRKSNYEAIEAKRGSLYHLIWKRKFTWIFVLGGMGFLLFETFHPDRANRTERMKNEWAHLSGGAYEATKPQKENKVAKE